MSALVRNWRKSTRSSTNTACVEVGSTAEIVAVRDTKARDLATFEVTPAEWRGFLATFTR